MKPKTKPTKRTKADREHEFWCFAESITGRRDLAKRVVATKKP